MGNGKTAKSKPPGASRPVWIRFPNGRTVSYPTKGEALVAWRENYEGYMVSRMDEGWVYYRNPDAYPDAGSVPPADGIIRMGRTSARIEEV